MKIDSLDIIASGCIIGVLAIFVTFIIIYFGRFGYRVTKEEFNVYYVKKKSPLLAYLGIFYLGFSIKPEVGTLLIRSEIVSTVTGALLASILLYIGAIVLIFYVVDKNGKILQSLINSRDKTNKHKTILVNSIFGRIFFSFRDTPISNKKEQGINADDFIEHYENKSQDFKQYEEALLSHKDVLEANVVGKKDDINLVKPKAFIVLNNNISASKDLESELTSHVKSKLTPFKYPRWYEFVDTLSKDRTKELIKDPIKSNSEGLSSLSDKLIIENKIINNVKEITTKECPKCAETIKFKAVICRFCKYDFETDNFRE